MDTTNSFVVELEGCDRIEVHVKDGAFSLKVIACADLLKHLIDLKTQFGPDLKTWPLPTENSHVGILLRELILKAKGEWAFPYAHAELCHCRTIPTKIVDQAIILGAHHSSKVSRQTSASTACGTCRPEVEKIINYRLHRSR